MLSRRTTLFAPLLLAGPGCAAAAGAAADAADRPLRVATAWRLPGDGHPDSGQHVGVLEIDWNAGRVQLQTALPVPTRAHGLRALPDGGFLAVANRPGRWLLRCDAVGDVVQRLEIDAAQPQRTFNGHVEASGDGAWLYTTETDPHTGTGWVSVRDARTLTRAAQFESGGTDPHQLLCAADGTLMVANGGIPRDGLGRKIELERMAPALARIAPCSGQPLGHWTLPDPRLSLRHMAWAHGPAPLLGLALQAEHGAAAERAVAPALAVWDGDTLRIPTADARGGGYAGDIAAGPGGGFVVSAQRQGRGLWWHPGQPDGLTLVADLTEPCALLPLPDDAGVALSAGRGVARWHSRQPARMLAWPIALAPDNHWVSLAAT